MKDKKLSSYIEFETVEESKEEGFGISKYDVRRTKTGKKIAFCVCLLCGMHKKLNKTGANYILKLKAADRKDKELKYKLEEGLEIPARSKSKKYNPYKHTAYNLINIEEEPFISIRVRGNGKGGFYELPISETGRVEEGSIRLSDIPKQSKKDREMLLEIVDEIREQCKRILDYTDKLIKEKP